MKKLNALMIKSFLLLVTVAVCSTVSFGQKLDRAAVEKAIHSKHFMFKAESVLPMAGSTRYLTSDYGVKLSDDTLISYLPYFGRAYSVTYGERGGIDFTSTKFDYKVEPAKKSGWNVSIMPKDAGNVQSFNFSISEDGKAYLQVFSPNRQPIAFNGYIVEKK